MSEIKIKCPTCGKVLRLADAPNINQATFTCPICKDKHVVGNCQRFVEAPSFSSEETQYGGNANRSNYGGEETQIASVPQGTGCLVDSTGRSYLLYQGVNTIGRQAQTSTATVQIMTDDHYMSRSHAVIEVHQANGKVIHLLKNGVNKNPSYLNGNLIADGDQLILNNGDRMKFGKTELTFKL